MYNFLDVEPIYTGGGIYIYFGHIIHNGKRKFFLSCDDCFDDIIIYKNDPKAENIDFDEYTMQEYIDKWMDEEITEKEAYIFNQQMYRFIVTTKPDSSDIQYKINSSLSEFIEEYENEYNKYLDDEEAKEILKEFNEMFPQFKEEEEEEEEEEKSEAMKEEKENAERLAECEKIYTDVFEKMDYFKNNEWMELGFRWFWPFEISDFKEGLTTKEGIKNHIESNFEIYMDSCFEDLMTLAIKKDWFLFKNIMKENNNELRIIAEFTKLEPDFFRIVAKAHPMALKMILEEMEKIEEEEREEIKRRFLK